MATKLDKKFADGIKEGVQALIWEIERLEKYCAELESDNAKLYALEQVGVDNWDGYGEAMELLHK